VNIDVFRTKIYKTRFQVWGLTEYHKAERLEQARVASRLAKNTTSDSRLTAQRQYPTQSKEKMQANNISFHESAHHAITSMNLQTSDLPEHQLVPSPRMQRSIAAPTTFYIQEKFFRDTAVYISISIETGFWTRCFGEGNNWVTSPGPCPSSIRCTRSTVSDAFFTNITGGVQQWEAGNTALAGEYWRDGFAGVSDVIMSTHHDILLRCLEALTLLHEKGHVQLLGMLQTHISSMACIILPSSHPCLPVLRGLKQLEAADIMSIKGTFFLAFEQSIEKSLGPAHPLVQHWRESIEWARWVSKYEHERIAREAAFSICMSMVTSTSKLCMQLAPDLQSKEDQYRELLTNFEEAGVGWNKGGFWGGVRRCLKRWIWIF
jgi:hypothetical protein